MSASRTIAAMTGPSAARELVLLATVLVGLSRLVDGPAAWLVAALVFAAVALATLQVLADTAGAAPAAGVPIEHLIGPATTAVALIGAIRVVPAGLALAPALALGAWLLARVLATEARVLAAPAGPAPTDRTTILAEALIVGFLGFSGVAALVPGGLVEPATGPAGTPMLAGAALATLAIADGVLAFLLGYRAAALRTTRLRDVLLSALTYGVAVAVAAAALRAMAIPRLAGPALLTLVFFLWDAIHGAPPGRRTEARRIWELILLFALGAVVVGWTFLLGDV